MMRRNLSSAVNRFWPDHGPAVTCRHKHQLAGTGAVFFQSAGLLRCARCGGWQYIRKPVK